MAMTIKIFYYLFKNWGVVLFEKSKCDVHHSKSKYRYSHFGSFLGVDRLCPETITVFLPGFLYTLFGVHLTFIAIILPPCRDGVSRPFQDTAGWGGKWWTPIGTIHKFLLFLNGLFRIRECCI